MENPNAWESECMHEYYVSGMETSSSEISPITPKLYNYYQKLALGLLQHCNYSGIHTSRREEVMVLRRLIQQRNPCRRGVQLFSGHPGDGIAKMSTRLAAT